MLTNSLKRYNTGYIRGKKDQGKTALDKSSASVNLVDPLLRNSNLAVDSIDILIQEADQLVLHDQLLVDHDAHLLHPTDSLADLQDVLFLISHELLLQLQDALVIQLPRLVRLFGRPTQHSPRSMLAPISSASALPKHLLVVIRGRRTARRPIKHTPSMLNNQALQTRLQALNLLPTSPKQILAPPDLSLPKTPSATPPAIIVVIPPPPPQRRQRILQPRDPSRGPHQRGLGVRAPRMLLLRRLRALPLLEQLPRAVDLVAHFAVDIQPLSGIDNGVLRDPHHRLLALCVVVVVVAGQVEEAAPGRRGAPSAVVGGDDGAEVVLEILAPGLGQRGVVYGASEPGFWGQRAWWGQVGLHG